jgi:hypothetical protein
MTQKMSKNYLKKSTDCILCIPFLVVRTVGPQPTLPLEYTIQIIKQPFFDMYNSIILVKEYSLTLLMPVPLSLRLIFEISSSSRGENNE